MDYKKKKHSAALSFSTASENIILPLVLGYTVKTKKNPLFNPKAFDSMTYECMRI